MSRELGDIYEQRLLKYLLDSGWQLLAEKYIGGGGEIDLIVIRNKELCFIEVKGRQEGVFAEESIFSAMSKKKQRLLIACSEDFLEQYEDTISFEECYFVLGGYIGETLYWIENPFDGE